MKTETKTEGETRKTPKVNEVNEFLEIASDFEDPLEVIRESLSNAYDADAGRFEITIRTRDEGADIVLEDDGNGMDKDDLESFFDLGNSNKEDGIGYKGHGTKIFYKSDQIRVETSKNDKHLSAKMNRPWEKLNERELPEYEVTEQQRDNREGTKIEIIGFRSGKGLSEGSLTYNKIEHYLKWKTVAGSTAHFFEDDSREMEVIVDLDAYIDDTQKDLRINNHFEFPEEQIEPAGGRFPGEWMCKHYPAKTLQVEHDGGTSEVEIVGMVGGKRARNKLATYGKHSAQFGVWLAKDHIKVEQANEVVPDNVEHTHLFFVANCQDLELSANRGKIRNKSSDLYDRLLEEVRHYISKVCSDPWFSKYQDTLRRGEAQRRSESQSKSVEQRREKLIKRQDSEFVPENTAELLVALERVNRDKEEPIVELEDYRPDHDVTAFIRNGQGLEATSVEMSVQDHFEKERNLEVIDAIVAWEWGDLDYLREQERKGYLQGNVSIDFENKQITYSYDGASELVNAIIVEELR
ncbi:ATP-binding protein [Halorutilales archaeon Cl-col2-1]